MRTLSISVLVCTVAFMGVAFTGCTEDSGVSAFCGDGVTDIDEECDDGNNISGDGCSADCLIEELCVDADGDGADGYDAMTCPTGTDCDDTDAMVDTLVTLYPDLDDDGFADIGAIEEDVCTDGMTLPLGYTDVDPNTAADCDDADPYSADDTNDPFGFCALPGVCVDPDNDGRGVGACEYLDCDSTPGGVESSFSLSTTACTVATEDVDCDVVVNADFTGSCAETAVGGGACVLDPGGLCDAFQGTGTCAEIIGCLQACPDGDGACVLGCAAAGDDVAQALYDETQFCSAQAGCFAEADPAGCAAENCLSELGACTADAP